MNDTTLPAAERIRAFAEAVRAELADLSSEEIDDLVGGLEGDLTDQAEDAGGALELGDPAAYAHELRVAAGLPERSSTPPRERLGTRIAGGGARLLAKIRTSPFGAWLLDFLIALRPVWWVLRGVGLYVIVAAIFGIRRDSLAGQNSFPMFLVAWALLLLFVVVSVQWGRGRWLPGGAWRHIRTVLSIVAIIALPWGWNAVTAPLYVSDSAEPGFAPGLTLDGEQVGNLFVYDADGALVSGAQIFTDRGTPLDIFGEASAMIDDSAESWYWRGGENALIPLRDARGDAVWNVYPLRIAPVDPATGTVDPDAARDATPPFLRAPDRGITAPAPTPVPSPTPTPVAEPTEAPADESPAP
ncbi:hypothetical protein GCM10025768_02550 [Microbacterium pseudoresistens]|uniref:Uncharacterized protein n=1 Tax=Microbacterium pseudoresistens TaxID=640634 RepID=A0A7Y9EUM7_9MICO|nr:hypothetical protein [Microbacterium pseudoresistens]NYD54091.1 hypothetical protein [Microbacterium pseudoresistens]